MAPFDRSHASSYSSSIVTIPVSCIVFEIKLDIGRKTPNIHTPVQWLKWQIRSERAVHQLLAPAGFCRPLSVLYEIWGVGTLDLNNWRRRNCVPGTAFPCVQWHYNHSAFHLSFTIT